MCPLRDLRLMRTCIWVCVCACTIYVWRLEHRPKLVSLHVRMIEKSRFSTWSTMYCVCTALHHCWPYSISLGRFDSGYFVVNTKMYMYGVRSARTFLLAISRENKSGKRKKKKKKERKNLVEEPKTEIHKAARRTVRHARRHGNADWENLMESPLEFRDRWSPNRSCLTHVCSE